MKTYTYVGSKRALAFRAEETRPEGNLSSVVTIHPDDLPWFRALPKRVRLGIFDVVRQQEAKDRAEAERQRAQGQVQALIDARQLGA